jgi:hypothetical protein
MKKSKKRKLIRSEEKKTWRRRKIKVKTKKKNEGRKKGIFKGEK